MLILNFNELRKIQVCFQAHILHNQKWHRCSAILTPPKRRQNLHLLNTLYMECIQQQYRFIFSVSNVNEGIYEYWNILRFLLWGFIQKQQNSLLINHFSLFQLTIVSTWMPKEAKVSKTYDCIKCHRMVWLLHKYPEY